MMELKKIEIRTRADYELYKKVFLHFYFADNPRTAHLHSNNCHEYATFALAKIRAVEDELNENKKGGKNG